MGELVVSWIVFACSLALAVCGLLALIVTSSETRRRIYAENRWRDLEMNRASCCMVHENALEEIREAADRFEAGIPSVESSRFLREVVDALNKAGM